MQARHFALVLSGALALALAGCDRGATGNPTAQGSPGTGNAREVAAPVASDTAAGGPTGVKGSMAHPGSSGGDAVPGTTGSGTAGTAQPGTGLQGGLGNAGTGLAGNFPSPGASSAGASSRSMGAVASGSTNLTPKGSVGNRP